MANNDNNEIPEIEVTGKLLNNVEAIEIANKYGVEINPDDITQYKLLQVIYFLENKVKLAR